MNAQRVRRGVLGVCLIATIVLSVHEWRASHASSTIALVNVAPRAVALAASAARNAVKAHRVTAPAKASPVNQSTHATHAAQAASMPQASSTPQADTPNPKLGALRKPMSLESRNNPFAASSWLPPPPPVVQAPPEPAPPPTAPPVPYVYVGKLDGSALKPQVFLASGDQLLIVSQGEVVDGQYRVESISDADVVLTYLPLNQRQVISIPGEGP
jgi:hypothetical protein